MAADTKYGKGEFWQRDITPDMRTRDSVHRNNSPFYGPERFTYLPESNSYRCPEGQIALGAPGTTVGSNSGQGAVLVYFEPRTDWRTTSRLLLN